MANLTPLVRRLLLQVALPISVALSGASSAQAQPNPPQQGQNLQQPVLLKFVQAEYPAEAVKKQLQASVLLELDIDAKGQVVSVTVVDPAGNGFDEAAQAAARQFEWSPALRNGKPVPSRIRYRYNFTLEAPKPGTTDPTGKPAPPPKPAENNLRGRVDISGSTVALDGAEVVVEGKTGVIGRFKTDGSGTWGLRDLPPGKYKVTVSAPGYDPLSVEEEVTPGEATEVVYRLTPTGGGLEVVVKGERPPREVTKRTIERRELSRIPGTNGDALRALQNLPGVARPPGLAGLLIVRGSAPQSTGIFIDGTPIPLVYHFGGLSSVVPTEGIERLDFYPGNFSSQYGRFTGGIVDVGLRPTKNDGKYHGLVQADFIDARMMAEGPVPFTKNWNFIVGARRSYVDVWLGPVLEGAGAGVTSAPVYYDYQAFVETKPTDRSYFRVGVFGSDDSLELLIKSPAASEPLLGGNIGFGTSFWRVQALFRHEFTDKFKMQTVLAYGQDKIDFSLGSLFFKLTTNPLTNRLEFSYKLAKGATLNVGQDIYWAPYDIELRLPQPPRPGEPDGGPFVTRKPLYANESASLYMPAAFAELELVPHERVRVVSGFRADYYQPTNRWDPSPRLSARYIAHKEFPKTTIKGGVGLFHQPPQPNETNAIFGTPGLKSNRAVHYSTGVEQELTKQIDISVEGFYKQLDNDVSRSPSSTGGYTYNNLGTGKVIGIETLLRYKPDRRFFGWIAYTLSRSTRVDGPGQEEHLFQYDQTHILTMLGSYNLGRGWEFGTRFRLISGSLDTPCIGGILNSAAGAYGCVSSTPFSYRLPPFHSLDFRIDKRWVFQTWKLGIYLDVLNVYNRANPEGLNYNYNFTQFVHGSGLPILPSFGIRGEM